jgi:hypothetical protein
MQTVPAQATDFGHDPSELQLRVNDGQVFSWTI